MQSPPGTNVPRPPELRRSWVIAALAGAAAAGIAATLFVVLAPAPPQRKIDLPPLPPKPDVSAQPPAPSASLAVSVAPVHDWPEVEGIERAVAKSTLDKHEAEIRKCNKQPPSEDPEVAKAGVQVQLTIKADGTVEHVSILENDLTDEDFPACLERVLGKLRFKPKPGKEASVTMLWTF